MASQPDIREIVERYLAVIKEHGLRVSSVYLFGSWARGDATQASDIDVAVISEQFTGNRFRDSELLWKWRREVDVRIEPVPFRLDRFVRGHPLADEILKEGIRFT